MIMATVAGAGAWIVYDDVAPAKVEILGGLAMMSGAILALFTGKRCGGAVVVFVVLGLLLMSRLGLKSAILLWLIALPLIILIWPRGIRENNRN